MVQPVLVVLRTRNIQDTGVKMGVTKTHVLVKLGKALGGTNGINHCSFSVPIYIYYLPESVAGLNCDNEENKMGIASRTRGTVKNN